jgi:hypothetical protein
MGKLALSRNAFPFATAQITLAPQSDSTSIVPDIWQKAVAERLQSPEAVIAFRSRSGSVSAFCIHAVAFDRAPPDRVWSGGHEDIGRNAAGASDASGVWELKEDRILCLP